MKKKNNLISRNGLSVNTKAGINLVSFSQFQKINESRVNEAVEWPTEEEDKKSISILNKWLYELLNNGGGNAEDERRSGHLWYFSKAFKRYIKQAVETIKKLGLEKEMPTILKMAEMNDSENIMLGKDAANAYKEMDAISNWDDLQIGNLDFFQGDKVAGTDNGYDEDEDDYNESVNEARDMEFDIIIKPKNCDIDSGDMMYVEAGGTASMAEAYNEGALFTKKQVDEEMKKMKDGEDGYNWLQESIRMEEDGDAIIEVEVVQIVKKPVKKEKFKFKFESESDD